MNPELCAEIGRDTHLPLLPAALWSAPDLAPAWAALQPLLDEIAQARAAEESGQYTAAAHALDRRLGLIRGRPWLDRPRREAAVLVGLFREDVTEGASLGDVPGPWQLLLTRRADSLREHAGEISFPGGRIDPGDRDATACALRESHEEIGLPPASVQVLGGLPAYTTVTHYRVVPVLAQVTAPAARTAIAASANSEVERAFAVPLAHVLDPCQHLWRTYERGGVERRFVAMPWRSPAGESAPIWGATAAMLRNLYLLLAWSLCAPQMQAAAAAQPWRNES